jgi:hypothetical protein
MGRAALYWALIIEGSLLSWVEGQSGAVKVDRQLEPLPFRKPSEEYLIHRLLALSPSATPSVIR